MIGRRAFLALASAIGLAGCTQESAPQQDSQQQDSTMTDRTPRHFNDDDELTSPVNNELVSTGGLSSDSSISKWALSNPHDQILLKKRTSTPTWNVRSTPVIQDTTLDANGLGFRTIIDAGKFFTNPKAPYYIYVSGHDADGIWLYTADTIGGEWTLDDPTPILTTSDFAWMSGHISSPDAVWNEDSDELYLYVHGVDSNGAQPTGLAKTTDGETFSTVDSPVLDVGQHENKWNGWGAGYATVSKYGGQFVAAFQANGVFSGPDGRCANVGIAYSSDGEDWTTKTKPLISNDPGSRGPFAPAIYPVGDGWLILHGRNGGLDDIYSRFSPTLDAGDVSPAEVEIERGGSNSWMSDGVNSPKLHYDRHTNELFMTFVGFDSNETRSLGIAKADFGGWA